MTVNAMQTIDQIESQLWEAADQLRAELRTASGDLFGRIYEYFLMKFAMQGAQDNGEFFTPPSLVQTIVNVIEPDHGIVFDPACGSVGRERVGVRVGWGGCHGSPVDCQKAQTAG